MMPHQDPARRYSTPDPTAVRDAAIDRLGRMREAYDQGSLRPRDRAIFEIFVLPTLGPKPVGEPTDWQVDAYSFITADGAEVRLGFYHDADDWLEFELSVFRLQADGCWFQSAYRRLTNDEVDALERCTDVAQRSGNLVWCEPVESLFPRRLVAVQLQAADFRPVSVMLEEMGASGRWALIQRWIELPADDLPSLHEGCRRTLEMAAQAVRALRP